MNEISLKANGCQFTSRLTSEVLAVGTEIDSCQSLCEGDPDCWATVEYVPDNCVTLALPGHGVQNLTLTTKFCYNITLNTTTAITPDLTNNNVVPNATCGSFAITPTPTNSSVVSSIALPPCQPVNVTQNVTLTSTESITVTTTNYSTFTSTFTSTEQITVTSTVLSTYTQNVTTEQAEEIAAEIAKNLTIDSKSTSSHIRRLTSAEDKRRSAKFVGYVGVIFVAAPLGIMLLLDIKKLFLDFRSHDDIYKKK
ncbi:uncharacterized protein LOC123546325 [Mercenaria mercenaria]|uniref:uncharacterized protein LOC123546325 n=1 Tax=Mercenaria mercenaria TaxID=6596 RepID=UPI00234E67A3|nr:uncharacterized protein LOC123546325 [Mercenaria mercenaria]